MQKDTRWMFLFLLPVIFQLLSFSSYASDMNTGLSEFEKGNYKIAHDIFHRLAEGGCSDAMWAMGMIYFEGSGVSRNYQMAIKWFKAAAELGDPDAMNTIGYMHETGKGAAVDLTQAAEWYRKAVEYGSVNAMYCLAILNVKQQRLVVANKWYQLAKRYQYEFSDEDRVFFNNAFKPFSGDGRLAENTRAQVRQWIEKHPDYQLFLDDLNSSDPNC